MDAVKWPDGHRFEDVCNAMPRHAHRRRRVQLLSGLAAAAVPVVDEAVNTAAELEESMQKAYGEMNDSKTAFDPTELPDTDSDEDAGY